MVQLYLTEGKKKKTKTKKTAKQKNTKQGKKKEKKQQLKQGLKAEFPISLFNFQLEVVVSTLYRINSPLQAFLSFACCMFHLYKLQVQNLQVASLKSYVKQEDKTQHLFPKNWSPTIFSVPLFPVPQSSSTDGYEIFFASTKQQAT